MFVCHMLFPLLFIIIALIKIILALVGFSASLELKKLTATRSHYQNTTDMMMLKTG